MKDGKRRYGSLAVGVLATLVNLHMVGRVHPILAVCAIAGICGMIAAPAAPALGIVLVLLGSWPGLACGVGLLLQENFHRLIGPVFLLPAILMIVCAARIRGSARPKEEPAAPRNLQFPCDRCGVWFAPAANPWHDAGFCSRKCLECAR